MNIRTAILTALLSFSAVTAAWAEEQIIRVGGNVEQANLLSQVIPMYPAQAKQDRVQGTVQLQIIIDKEGHVTDISLLGGPEALVQAAVDAVKQWTYKPTLLNGEPVRVETTVNVNFTLSQ